MRPTARDLLILLGILLLATGLRARALSGEMGPDSTVYAQYAWNLLHGDFSLGNSNQYTHRLPVFAPVSLFYAVGGVGRVTTAAWPLLLSLVGIATAFWLGRRLFGSAAGVIAALVLATLPLDAIEAGRLMPDVVMGSLIGLSGAVWMGARDRGRLAGVASGILVALAAGVRPYSLLMLPLFVADAWATPDRRRRLLWVALGIVIVLVPGGIAYAVQTGDPLYRLHVISGLYSSGVLGEGARFEYYPRLIRMPWHETGLHPLLLVGCVLLCLPRPGPERARLLLWLGAFFGFLQFGSMSLTEWVPILKRIRFLTPLSLPAAVLVGSVVAGVAGWTGETRWWTRARGAWRSLLRVGVGAGLAGLLALCIWQIELDRRERLPRFEAFDAIAARLQHGDSIVVDHWRTSIRLAWHLGYEFGAHYYLVDDRHRMDPDAQAPDAEMGYLRWYANADDVPAGWVVTDEETLAGMRRLGDLQRTFADEDVPEWALQLPEDWQLEVERAGLRLYRTPRGSGAAASGD